MNAAINSSLNSDHPTLDDKIDRLELIKLKAAQIAHCTPPHCFGIHGDWGAGKTSFLRQLRYHLDGQEEGCEKSERNNAPEKAKYGNQVITMWFDAWRYQHEASPVIALLHEMRRQFTTYAKFKKKAAKLTGVTVRSLLNSFNDITKQLGLETFGVNANKIQQTGEQWEKQHLETRLGTDTVQYFLQQAISQLIKSLGNKGCSRLVIFIDDLDRCSSSAAYRLLEGLKIYLDIDNCVFVIGMNQKIVVDAIAKEINTKSSGDEQSVNTIYAEAYLEKLCSNIERLPPPKAPCKLFNQWLEQCHKNTQNNLNNDIFIEFTDALQNEHGFLDCLPPNPRKIKALANQVFQWLELVCHQQHKNIDPILKYRILMLIAYVYQFHSELFQRWQHTPEFFDQLDKWAQCEFKTDDDKDTPSYFSALELPFAKDNDEHPVEDNAQPSQVSEPTPIYGDGETESNTKRFTSRFPDPYAVNVFWAQPLLTDQKLKLSNVTAIMQAITHGKSANT